MKDCVFCKIVEGSLPSVKLYEDDKVIVILDQRPVRYGHCMVIPKIHIDHFIDLPEQTVSHIGVIAHRIAKKIQSELNPPRVGFVVSGFGVPHAHYHVIPLQDEQDITSARYLQIENGKAFFRMDHLPFYSEEEKENLRRTIRL